MAMILLFCAALLSNSVSDGTPQSGSAQHRLLYRLSEDYPKQGQAAVPRISLEPVGVNVSLSAPIITSVNDKKPSVSFKCYLRQKWTDEFLRWDPADYDGLKVIQIPSELVWLPDITIWTLLSERCSRGNVVTVKYTGQVLYIQYCVHEVRCSVDITYFPFDTQFCVYQMGSFSHNMETLNITHFETDKLLNKENEDDNENEWDLQNLNHQRREVEYFSSFLNMTTTIPYVTVRFWIRHDVPLFAFLLILPAVLLSVMTSVVFLVPTQSDNKVELGLEIFVAFSVLLNIMMASLPKASHTMPVLGYYFTLNSFLIALSVFCSTVILNVLAKSESYHKLPRKAKKPLLLACKALFMKIQESPQTPEPEKEQAERLTSSKPIRSHLVENEWLLLAQLLDRFFFLLYLITNMIGTIVIFTKYKGEAL